MSKWTIHDAQELAQVSISKTEVNWGQFLIENGTGLKIGQQIKADSYRTL